MIRQFSPRDYLVPAPTENWQAMRKKLVEPPQLSNYFRMVLQMLGTPKFEDGRWRVNASMELVPAELSLFWKGHSPRHFLPQASAAIGCDKHDRDFLGRWSIGRVGSNAYLHTSRQITERIQQQVRDSFYGADVAYDESELLDSVREFAEKSDLSGQRQRVRRRHKMLPLPKADDMIRYGYEEESDEEDRNNRLTGNTPHRSMWMTTWRTLSRSPGGQASGGFMLLANVMSMQNDVSKLKQLSQSLLQALMPFAGCVRGS